MEGVGLKRILFLQGPLGAFFQQVAQYFHANHHKTYKINFNGGDRHYAWANQVDDFTGKPEQWSTYLHEYITKYQIDTVVVYGDCRFYHAEAAKVAKKLAIDFWVCEEGYLRAGFVTFENGGCNANSLLDRSSKAIIDANEQPIISDQQVGNTFYQRTIVASTYYWKMKQNTKQFPYYHHHRPWVWWQEGLFWFHNFKQKFISRVIDPTALKAFSKKYHKQYFLLPLQVEIDFQMRQHSRFNSVKESIRYTLESFAQNANENDALLIKHHPQARGFVHYGEFIKTLCKELAITERVLYVHHANLPNIYQSCKGVVTVNSTVGLSAVLHYLPTITLGKAIYNLPQLTFQGELKDFWQSDFQVDESFFQLFQGYLQAKTQIQGDFYKTSEKFLARMYQKIMTPKPLANQSKEVVADVIVKLAEESTTLDSIKQKYA